MRVNEVGLPDDRIQEITKHPEHVFFPPPVKGSLFSWATELDGEQLLAATLIYTDLWTWDNGVPFHKEVLQVLEQEIELRGGLEPNTGDLLYSMADKKNYFYTGKRWTAFSTPNGQNYNPEWELDYE